MLKLENPIALVTIYILVILFGNILIIFFGNLLNKKHNELKNLNNQLQDEINFRKTSEEKIKEQNSSLQTKIEQIKTLKSLLPICASCKKIRDNNG